ncbi:MAG: 16S rRNA (cytosine(967)-C(5))-methyltransferase RsmB [Deltaproteobacteria bacterium]|nr:16S rRNA (cytosine(967)-C(5))-methyltransferase RsmB [Deltaproteobacteria bacterium]
MEKGKRPGNTRSLALKVIERVETGAYADIILDAGLSGLDEVDAALATELVYGVLRWMRRIDWVIDTFSSIKTAKLERRVLDALRLGVYQLLFLDRIPPRAAINETVNLVKAGGERKAGFVNAVLRAVDAGSTKVVWPDKEKDPVRFLSVFYSHPEWLVKRWVEMLGIDEAEALLRANNERPPRTVRVNAILSSKETLIKELGAGPCAYSPVCLKVEGRVDAHERRYYIQDEASQLVPLLLRLKPGMTVLDACAAPGGKTTHMAGLMGNKGLVLALDRYAGRLKTVDKAAERLGASIIRTVEADSERPLPFREETFDAILLDAPCSGLGVLRRAPDMKMRRRESDIRGLAARQKALIENLSRYLKKGGRLVYSTCTFEPEETDGIVKGFLDRFKGFRLEDAGEGLPASCAKLIDRDGFLRTYPHRDGLDGFFGAVLVKEG